MPVKDELLKVSQVMHGDRRLRMASAILKQHHWLEADSTVFESLRENYFQPSSHIQPNYQSNV